MVQWDTCSYLAARRQHLRVRQEFYGAVVTKVVSGNRNVKLDGPRWWWIWGAVLERFWGVGGAVMGGNCVVYNCNKRGGHKFPQDKTLRKAWLARIRREETFIPTAYSTVCRAHFTRGLFHVTFVRPTDVRLRRRENVRPLSLRTFACSTLRRRSFAGRTYDHSQRWHRVADPDVLKTIYHGEYGFITSICFYYIHYRPIQKVYYKFQHNWMFNICLSSWFCLRLSTVLLNRLQTVIFGMLILCAVFRWFCCSDGHAA